VKTSFIPISNVVKDWVEDNDLGHIEINEPLIIKWGVDALNMMNLTEILRNKIALLPVANSKATLPTDFKTLTFAAANVKDRQFVRTRREELSEWVQGTYEKDCKLKIKLICDECHKPEVQCDCMGGNNSKRHSFEVDVDRIWEMAHPEIYYSHYTRLGRFGYGPQSGQSDSQPRFELMRVATHDLHRSNIILGDCPNLYCEECAHTFRLDPPLVELDFQEGEVLLSYLGRKLDENGDPLIPDHPDVLEAIQNHINYKWYDRKWNKESDRNAKIKKDEALQLREVNMGLAKSIIETPEYSEIDTWMKLSLFKRMPDMNTHANLNKRTRDRYDILGDKLKY